FEGGPARSMPASERRSAQGVADGVELGVADEVGDLLIAHARHDLRVHGEDDGAPAGAVGCREEPVAGERARVAEHRPAVGAVAEEAEARAVATGAGR